MKGYTASYIAKHLGYNSAVELNNLLFKLGLQEKNEKGIWIFKDLNHKRFEKIIEISVKNKKITNRVFTYEGVIFLESYLREKGYHKNKVMIF